ncbi:MAG: zinc ribbon domain-containing protein [Trebonia sp.]
MGNTGFPGAEPVPQPTADLDVDLSRAVVQPGGAWQLAGSVCAACAAVTFPARARCHRCLSGDVAAVPVGRGRTVQLGHRARVVLPPGALHPRLRRPTA